MFCSIKSPAVRRLTNRVLGTMVLNILFAVIAALAIRFAHLRGIAGYLVAVLPALPIVGVIVAFGVFLEEEKDEFQRNLMVQALLGGIGGTLVATTVWGNLEAFVHVPHLQSIWIYPIFWLFVGLSTPVVLWRYR
jgi:hypothetical protein